MIRRHLLALAALLAAPALAFGQEPLKVGFIYVGPIGDHGWTYQHEQGRLAVEAAFGDRVETTYVESVSEGPDAERVLRQLAASGHGLIFTTSFGYMDATASVAKQFPDVKFEHATGYTRGDNLSTYSARFYEGRAVIGTIAARMTKSKQIGYIASFPIPEVVRGINAVALAARKIDPEITVNVVWVNTWYDPGKEADAAKALIAQGADVIMQHTDSPAALQAAELAGVFAFGQASDMHRFAPNSQLTAIVDDWSTYYVDRVQAVLDGTWESTDTWGGIEAGMVALSPYWNMDYETAVIAHDLAEDIRLGVVHPFEGPIVDRDGTERVPAGATADDGMLLGMDFFVEGVVGDLPK